MKPLTDQQLAEFHRDGFVCIRNAYSVSQDVEPIQRSIYDLIKLLIRKYDLTIDQPEYSPETFDAGYQALIAHDRAIGGEIYDAVKQIPAFIRLVGHPLHEAVMRQVRSTDMPAVAAGGYGIRIDNPHEEQFRAPWHQDYSAQFRSLDGLVFWSPLVSMTPEMGPVQLCRGSHHDGLIRVHTKDPKNPEKKGAYALILEEEDKRIANYEHAAPLAAPGDLVLLDYLAIHRSGLNTSDRSRWSMQMRYFNFAEPNGIKIKWAGAYAANNNVKEVHPELFID